MEKVLIATLGDSPQVVSGMVNVLNERENQGLDRVQILYPDEPNERWISVGYDWLEELLSPQLLVEPVPLPFADAHTEQDSLRFLHIVNGLLQGHDAKGNSVYLSLAGGRKHLSTLMAILPQFYPCVKGLYHLHDKKKDNPQKQRSIEELGQMGKDERDHCLNLPADRFHLVELPCTHLANARELQKWLSRQEKGGSTPPAEITPEAESYYAKLFQPPAPSEQTTLSIQLTETAYQQYCELSNQGGSRPQVIDSYLRDMSKADWLRGPERLHHELTDPDPAHCQEGTGKPLQHMTCKKARTAERVYYYTQPHPIKAQKESVERVVITRFPVHINEKAYDVSLEDWIKNPDIMPRYHVSDLPARPVTLIAPLGETPMVITQACTLLQSPQHIIPPLKVVSIHVIYPGCHVPSQNSWKMLKAVCAKRDILLHSHPVPIADLDSHTAVDSFVAGLRQAIADARRNNSNAKVELLLSGGRKGMSAIAFHVAQTQGIMRAYHTTVIDPLREKEIEQKTSYEALKSCSAKKQAEVLFLDQYGTADFTLIPVPVLSLSSSS